MDGYSIHQENDYVDQNLQYTFSEGAKLRNELISAELKDIKNTMQITFVTPTQYEI